MPCVTILTLNRLDRQDSSSRVGFDLSNLSWVGHVEEHHTSALSVFGQEIPFQPGERVRVTAPTPGIVPRFVGDLGTGKTMAAKPLGREVHRELYRIDLSAVVSNRIGGTENNLWQVSDTAERSDTILFFDEADALFGKRPVTPRPRLRRRAAIL